MITCSNKRQPVIHYKKKVFFSVKQVLVVSTKISMCLELKNLGGLPYKSDRDAHHTQGCKLQILVSLIQGNWDRKSLYMPIQVLLMAVLKEVLKKCHMISVLEWSPSANTLVSLRGLILIFQQASLPTTIMWESLLALKQTHSSFSFSPKTIACLSQLMTS